MFERIRLKNFKAWGEQLWDHGVELAPVTLLLGPNSAGKTSLLQVPLLLQQTFLSPDRTLDLNFGGQAEDRLYLGGYQDVVCEHDITRNIGIGLRLRQNGSLCVDYTAEWLHRADHAESQLLEYRVDGNDYAAERQSRAGYKLRAPGYTAPVYGNREFRPERSVAFSAEAVAELAEAKLLTQSQQIQDVALKLRRAVAQIAYLGPLREPPRRTYLWADQNPGNLGDTGKQAVMALLASKYSRRKADDTGEFGPEWLVERTSHWLNRLGLAERLELKQQGRSRHYEVQVRRGASEEANLVDVGFGVSQVLPMIVLAHFVPRGTTIIAEQPEIHLHPRAQVGLAELMVEVAISRDVQFIVETHSEHLFRRLQTLVARKVITPAQCRLYFVDRDETGHPHLDRLELDEFGRIANWPDGFFGDSVGEMEQQMALMFDRMTGVSHDGQ
ncbi:MAG: DUF3696 domain-containing protein [Myxococcota bacterium]